jgi:hypothetical protein
MAKTQNIVQFASERGLVTEYDVLSHIHAGLRSMPTTKAYARRNGQELQRLQRARDATAEAYKQAVAAGDVIPPPKPTLQERAAGHPDLPSTQAAIRLLEKRAQKGQAPT